MRSVSVSGRATRLRGATRRITNRILVVEFRGPPWSRVSRRADIFFRLWGVTFCGEPTIRHGGSGSCLLTPRWSAQHAPSGTDEDEKREPFALVVPALPRSSASDSANITFWGWFCGFSAALAASLADFCRAAQRTRGLPPPSCIRFQYSRPRWSRFGAGLTTKSCSLPPEPPSFVRLFKGRTGVSQL